jgi:hypothetical protein
MIVIDGVVGPDDPNPGGGAWESRPATAIDIHHRQPIRVSCNNAMWGMKITYVRQSLQVDSIQHLVP